MKQIHIATYQRDIHKGIPVAEHLSRDLKDPGHSVVVRLGGSMPYEKYKIHVNSAQAIKNSIDKRIQKQLLIKNRIPTLGLISAPVYPCVVKAINRSGGLNVHLVKNDKEYRVAAEATRNNFIIEPYMEATSEYRLHCTRKEVFFAAKKFKRNPADVIVTRDNHYNKQDFIKPRLWNEIKAACIKAMTALDLDIACFDVIYNSKDPNGHKFAICEANTNPELLLNTYNAYVVALNNIIKEKAEALGQPVPKVLEVPDEGNCIVYPDAGKALKVEFKPAEEYRKLTSKEKILVAEKLFENEYRFDGKTVEILLN